MRYQNSDKISQIWGKFPFFWLMFMFVQVQGFTPKPNGVLMILNSSIAGLKIKNTEGSG